MVTVFLGTFFGGVYVTSTVVVFSGGVVVVSTGVGVFFGGVDVF